MLMYLPKQLLVLLMLMVNWELCLLTVSSTLAQLE
jgi:hypothetical protein